MARSLLRHGNLSISLEHVDFQNRSFGDRLTSLTASIFEKIELGVSSTSLQNEAEVKFMEEFILKEKGLRVKLITDSHLAATLPFYPNKNFNMMEEFFRGNFTISHQEQILRQANGKKGTVDIKRARVGGLFSEGTSILYINFYVIKKTFNMTPQETAAVIMHELGHDFAACLFSDRFTRTNQVLAAASREIFKKNGKKNLDYVFKELQSVNEEVTIAEVDSILNGDRIIAGVKWHSFLIDTVVSELRDDKYNENSFEQLADSFASRHGYGKELVIALDKLSMSYPNVEKFASARRFAIALDALYLIIMPFMLVGMIGATPIIGGIITVIFIFSLYDKGDAGRDNTYDELKQRYTRIRSELISALKDNNISKKESEFYINEIKTIDVAINSTTDYYDLSRIISNVLFAKNRRARKSIEYQKTIEGLVTNDLFLHSAKFKNM